MGVAGLLELKMQATVETKHNSKIVDVDYVRFLVATMWRPPSWLKAIPRASESGGKAGLRSHISNGHLRPSSSPTSKGDCCFLPFFQEETRVKEL